MGAESVDANGARRGFPSSMAPHNKTLELTAMGPTGTVSQVALRCVEAATRRGNSTSMLGGLSLLLAGLRDGGAHSDLGKGWGSKGRAGWLD